jgi:hypothetical protein
MSKPKHGDIIAVPLPDGTYLCGRVMLDIYACLKRRLFPAHSPLARTLGGAFLIEMYRHVSPRPEYVPFPVLVPGAFVDCFDELGSSWSIVAHQDVDPHTVEFPEGLIGYRTTVGQVAFDCGEIEIALPFKHAELDVIEEYNALHSTFLWPFTCLRLLGRDTEVPADYKMASLAGSDLRFSPHRDRVYAQLPFPKELSYFEKQAQFGLHFERLYSN